MKIFFNASLTGKKDYQENYEKIRDAIKKTSHKLIAAPVFDYKKEEMIKADADVFNDYYQKLTKWVRDSEICVFEASFPSTSMGHEIAMALHASKPVIALHVKGAPKNIVLESIQDDRLQLIEYSPDDIEKTVGLALDYAIENMDIRFNFFISPQIGTYLDWISKYKKIPRAVFLRQLIEEDMKDSGYTS